MLPYNKLVFLGAANLFSTNKWMFLKLIFHLQTVLCNKIDINEMLNEEGVVLLFQLLAYVLSITTIQCFACTLKIYIYS